MIFIHSYYGATFISTPKRNPWTRPSLHPQTPGNPTHLLSVSVDFPLPGISYKWNRMHGFKAHSRGSVEQSLLPFHNWIFLWTYSVLLTPSSVDGPLGCVCLLVLMDSAAVNLDSQVFRGRFQFFWVRSQWVFPLRMCLRPPTRGTSFWARAKARELWRPRGMGTEHRQVTGRARSRGHAGGG